MFVARDAPNLLRTSRGDSTSQAFVSGGLSTLCYHALQNEPLRRDTHITTLPKHLTYPIKSDSTSLNDVLQSSCSRWTKKEEQRGNGATGHRGKKQKLATTAVDASNAAEAALVARPVAD